MLAVPTSVEGLGSENVNNIIKIDQNDIQKVDAATYKKVWYKKYYKKWYKSYGRWRYYWKYSWKYKLVKTSTTVKKSSSSYKTSSTNSTTTKYKKVRYKKYYKKWYKSYGRWRYYWKYRWATKYVKVTTKTAVKSTVTNTPDPSNKYGARDVKVTDNDVQSSGRCTCSLYEDYNYHTSKFVNYCPYCGKKSTLDYEEGTAVSSSGKVYNNPEGMWVCSTKKNGCDADFCLVHGKAHVTSGAKYLTPA